MIETPIQICMYCGVMAEFAASFELYVCLVEYLPGEIGSINSN